MTEFRNWDQTVDARAAKRAMRELANVLEHAGGGLDVVSIETVSEDNEQWKLTFTIDSLSRHGWAVLAYIVHFVNDEPGPALAGKVGLEIRTSEAELQYRIVIDQPEPIPQLAAWIARNRERFSEFLAPLADTADLREQGLIPPDEAARWKRPSNMRKAGFVSPDAQREWKTAAQLRDQGLIPPAEAATWVEEKGLRDQGLVSPAEAAGFCANPAEVVKWPTRDELIAQGKVAPETAARWRARGEL